MVVVLTLIGTTGGILVSGQDARAGTVYGSPSFAPTEILVAAAANWTANGGNHVLFVNFYDNWVHHGGTDGTSWQWWSEDAMVRDKWSMGIALMNVGLNVTYAGDIPANLSAYDAVVISAYYACEPVFSAELRSYVANGGGLVLIGGTPEYFRCYSKASSTYLIPTDPLSLSNPDWMGFTGYENTGGTAAVTVDHPFGTPFTVGQVMVEAGGSSGASVTGVNGTVIVGWNGGQAFACSHQFAAGRFYYQAGYATSHSGPPSGRYVGVVASQFGYVMPTASVSIDGGAGQQCNGSGGFDFELAVGTHSATFSAWGHDPQTVQLTVALDETGNAGTIHLSVNNSAMGLVHYTDSKAQSLLTPSGWVREENVQVGPARADLKLTGPLLGGIVTNVLVQSGTNASVDASIGQFWSIINESISGLQGYGITAALYEAPVFKMVDGRSAMVYSIVETAYGMVQKQAIIVDVAAHHYWIITFTISQSSYAQYEPMFDQMVMSFSGSNQNFGEAAVDYGNLWLIAVAVVVIGAAAVILILVVRRRGTRTGATGTSPAATGPTMWNCPSCGAINGADAIYCQKCGKRKE